MLISKECDYKKMHCILRSKFAKANFALHVATTKDIKESSRDRWWMIFTSISAGNMANGNPDAIL